MEALISWEIDLLAVVVIVITCVVAWVKMQQTIKANHDLANNEFKHMVKTIEDLKNDFKEDLEILKEDLKEHIGQLNEAESRALEDTKAELKEDIARLERKQAESNCIKERLAKVEIYLESIRARMNMN